MSARSFPLLLFLFSAGLACDASFMEPGPTEVCTEVAAQCVLAKGPLGVCEQIPCSVEKSEPCFVCASQH